MYLFKLLNISIIQALKIPLKITILFVLGSLGIINRKKAFHNIELSRSLNRVSFHKTIWFNYRSLDKETAKKFPIHVYTNTQIVSSSGRIVFEDTEVKFGMIRWGWFHTYRSQGKTRIQNDGTIIFRGEGKIFQGSEIVTWPESRLDISKEFFIGENVLLFCQHHIILEECVCISYSSDISDSDFHYCIDTNNGKVFKKVATIHIGSYNWIGHHTTIKKGTKTPSYTMVASAYAVLSKDYTQIIPEYSILGGIPAKKIKENISRIWFDERNQIKRLDNLIASQTNLTFSKKDIEQLTRL